MITQLQPDHTSNPSFVLLPVQILNNDDGITYESFTLSTEALIDDLHSIPRNQALYGLQGQLVGDWQIAIGPSSEVATGWLMSGSVNPITYSHQAGTIGTDYDGWFASTQDPSQDTMILMFGIPKNQLDGDGDGWSADDENDYLLGLGGFNAEFGYGMDSSFNAYTASGYNYVIQAVPEPSTVVLICFGLIGVCGRRFAGMRTAGR